MLQVFLLVYWLYDDCYSSGRKYRNKKNRSYVDDLEYHVFNKRIEKVAFLSVSIAIFGQSVNVYILPQYSGPLLLNNIFMKT